MSILAIYGYRSSGRKTVANILVENGLYRERIDLADKPKILTAYIFGLPLYFFYYPKSECSIFRIEYPTESHLKKIFENNFDTWGPYLERFYKEIPEKDLYGITPQILYERLESICRSVNPEIWTYQIPI